MNKKLSLEELIPEDTIVEIQFDEGNSEPQVGDISQMQNTHQLVFRWCAHSARINSICRIRLLSTTRETFG